MRARALFVVSLVLVATTLVPPSPSSWASTPSGSVLHGVTAVSTTDIWAAGYVVSNGVSRGLMERWNGSSWKIVPTPTSGTSNAFLNELAVIGSNDVWVVGDRNNTKVLEGANGK